MLVDFLRRMRPALLALSIGAVGSLTLAELGLRFALFHDSALARRIGGELRQPGRFCDTRGGQNEDFWRLQHLFADRSRLLSTPNYDETLGWTGSFITPGTYEHMRTCPPDGRELVLLYGDSYAQCNTPEDECFPTILASSDLGATHCMVNYGVGGYGLDQIYLLMKGSIDHYAERDPLVIVSLLIEDDIDRSVLSFRCWPKPRLDVTEDGLALREPVIEGADAFLDRHPPEIPSYLWRLFLFSQSPFLADFRKSLRERDDGRRAEKVALGRELLVEIHRELESRGLRHAVLLFHVEHSIRTRKEPTWQENLVREVCGELDVPVYSTREHLIEAGCDTDERAARLFGREGPTRGHHSAQGNVVAFEAIRECIEALGGRAASSPAARLSTR